MIKELPLWINAYELGWAVYVGTWDEWYGYLWAPGSVARSLYGKLPKNGFEAFLDGIMSKMLTLAEEMDAYSFPRLPRYNAGPAKMCMY